MFIVSNVLLLLGISFGVVMAWSSRMRPSSAIKVFVAIALLVWCLTLASGIWATQLPTLRVLHGLSGYLVLLFAAIGSGVWFGGVLPSSMRQRRPVIGRVVFALLLCFFCWSNTRTGYLGPTRVDAVRNEPTANRFIIIHKGAFGITIGMMLAIWLVRVRASAIPHQLIKENSETHGPADE